MTHLSLFTGIGGIDLAAEWAGFKTVGQCESADYPTAILQKHWRSVPRWRDIRNVNEKSFHERTGLSTVDLVSGGFPCQPFSVAGKQKGKGDDRYLWPEMLRVIGEIKPGWVLGENVSGILRIAADDICKDLERAGYKVGIFHYEAAAVGALHRRARVFFVAHADKPGLQGWNGEKLCEYSGQQPVGAGGSPVAHANGIRRERDLGRQTEFQPENYRWWDIEPAVGRVAHGIPNRVDRIKALGNAVVPQQIYPVLRAIAQLIQEET